MKSKYAVIVDEYKSPEGLVEEIESRASDYAHYRGLDPLKYTGLFGKINRLKHPVLDFSVLSLEHIDKIIGNIAKYEELRKLDELFVLPITDKNGLYDAGVYFGEVLRRNSGRSYIWTSYDVWSGAWMEDEFGEGSMLSTLNLLDNDQSNIVLFWWLFADRISKGWPPVLPEIQASGGVDGFLGTFSGKHKLPVILESAWK